MFTPVRPILIASLLVAILASSQAALGFHSAPGSSTDIFKQAYDVVIVSPCKIPSSCSDPSVRTTRQHIASSAGSGPQQYDRLKRYYGAVRSVPNPILRFLAIRRLMHPGEENDADPPYRRS